MSMVPGTVLLREYAALAEHQNDENPRMTFIADAEQGGTVRRKCRTTCRRPAAITQRYENKNHPQVTSALSPWHWGGRPHAAQSREEQRGGREQICMLAELHATYKDN
jgi:hypothetical protein